MVLRRPPWPPRGPEQRRFLSGLVRAQRRRCHRPGGGGIFVLGKPSEKHRVWIKNFVWIIWKTYNHQNNQAKSLIHIFPFSHMIQQAYRNSMWIIWEHLRKMFATDFWLWAFWLSTNLLGNDFDDGDFRNGSLMTITGWWYTVNNG